MPDLEFRINQAAFAKLLERVIGGIATFSGAGGFGLWFGCEGSFTLQDFSSLEFDGDDDTFDAREIDLKWNTLKLAFGIDIPTIEVGGFCLIRAPDFLGLGEICLLEFPRVRVFTKSPEVKQEIDLSTILSFIVSEVSILGSLEVNDHTDAAGKHQWRVTVHSEAIDVDPIDIHDTLGQSDVLLAAAIAAAAITLESAMPAAWVADLVLGLLGVPTFAELVMDVLDIQDDTEEWLKGVFNESIGIDNLIMNAIANAILKKSPIFKLKNPFPILPEQKGASTTNYGAFGPAGEDPTPLPTIDLAESGVPLKAPAIDFTDSELVVSVDLG